MGDTNTVVAHLRHAPRVGIAGVGMLMLESSESEKTARQHHCEGRIMSERAREASPPALLCVPHNASTMPGRAHPGQHQRNPHQNHGPRHRARPDENAGREFARDQATQRMHGRLIHHSRALKLPEATTLTTNLLPKLYQHRPWGRDVASTGSPCRATPSLTNIS